MTSKQGIDLLQEKLAEAGRSRIENKNEAANPPPLPAGLTEFVRQMAQRNGIDPATGEQLVNSGPDTR